MLFIDWIIYSRTLKLIVDQLTLCYELPCFLSLCWQVVLNNKWRHDLPNGRYWVGKWRSRSRPNVRGFFYQILWQPFVIDNHALPCFTTTEKYYFVKTFIKNVTWAPSARVANPKQYSFTKLKPVRFARFAVGQSYDLSRSIFETFFLLPYLILQDNVC